MYNTLLEKQANDAKEDINDIVKKLIIEVNESKKAFNKLEGKINKLKDIIEKLKEELHYHKNK